MVGQVLDAPTVPQDEIRMKNPNSMTNNVPKLNLYM
jgi:hypothetical protein